ncbi:ATP-binding protein [Pseudonocardia endophytica]|uniref:Histidine kinase/HSP90-like ATPase domain-containing protein n=1 Tax=Pseudonocardia endophytica TaxID=401976 RepID=A0A4R1HVG4_PSEEN|nr:ATP-binding protein [Pseudonocardia endophytica]TCK26737.1 hypothetical protein EV378_2582 [Pseudonocardia endophytica]
MAVAHTIPRGFTLIGCVATDLPTVRHLVRGLVDGGDLACDTALVVTELVTNAIDHGAGVDVLRVSVLPRSVVVEVDDHDAGGTPTVGRAGDDGACGHGLVLVGSCACWDVVWTDTGKTVWAILDAASRYDEAVPDLGGRPARPS